MVSLLENVVPLSTQVFIEIPLRPLCWSLRPLRLDS